MTINKISGILTRAFVAVVAVTGFGSCDSFFDLKPTNEMVLDEYWKSEDDVLSVTGSCYRYMQEGDFLKRLIVWGEFRSDNMIQGAYNTDNDLRYIANLNLLPTNSYTDWSHYYNVINLCNTVIEFAPGVREVDPNFTQSQLNGYIAEVKGIRAWCYFTLVKAFRDIPFVTQPTVDDTETFQTEQSDPDIVIDNLIEDLKSVEPSAVTSFGNKTYTKSRMTQAAIRALIADMCLWRGRYEECVEYCDKLLSDQNNMFAMENSMNYSRSLFVDGLSSETIFELNFSTANYSNYAVAHYYGLSSMGYGQQIAPYDFQAVGSPLFAETDLRARTSVYSSNSTSASIRKYISYMTASDLNSTSVTEANYHFTNPYESNWIIYRLPDVYFMKAEALAEQNTDLAEAFRLACITYDRANPEAGAGSLNFSDYSNREALLNFIYQERQREFLYEGKRYFDLLRRITHHRDQFHNIVSTYLTEKYADLDQTTVSTKLSSYDALFMPINSREMRANLLLKQNPFYRQSSDISR